MRACRIIWKRTFGRVVAFVQAFHERAALILGQLHILAGPLVVQPCSAVEVDVTVVVQPHAVVAGFIAPPFLRCHIIRNLDTMHD